MDKVSAKYIYNFGMYINIENFQLIIETVRTKFSASFTHKKQTCDSFMFSEPA